MSIQKVSSFQDEGGKLKAVASGTLPNGKPVVVNADGTVSACGQTSRSEVVGSPVVFEAGASDYIEIAYDANAKKVIIVYEDEDNLFYGTCVIGTVSGTSITFETPVVFLAGRVYDCEVTYMPNVQKVVISYRDNPNSNYLTSVVGTISGSSISFGTSSVFAASSNSDVVQSVYDAASGKIVIAYRDVQDNYYGKAVVGTVSGTSISFGSPVVFRSGMISWTSVIYDEVQEKVVFAYRDHVNSNYGAAVVGTVSGTSISFGSQTYFQTAYCLDICGDYDVASGKIVLAYRNNGNANYGTAVVGTVNGTSISFGASAVFNTGLTYPISLSYDAVAQKVVIAYRDSANLDYGTLITGTVSGTSITFGSAQVFENSAVTQYGSSVFDSDQNVIIIAYENTGNSSYGTAVVYQTAASPTNLTATNYIGISTGGAVADTGSATVDIIGSMNDAQTGLTAGQAYYVQTDGTLSTTADDPSVFAGTAINGTTILVKS
jgi:hypothetical protein